MTISDYTVKEKLVRSYRQSVPDIRRGLRQCHFLQDTLILKEEATKITQWPRGNVTTLNFSGHK